MVATLLFIQNSQANNDALPAHLKSLSYNLHRTEDVASAIQLIDDRGLRPSAVVVDVPKLTEKQIEMLEGIEESLGVHEWVFLTYDLRDDLAERLDEVAYRSIRQPCSNKLVEIAVKKAIRSTIVRRRLKEYAQTNTTKTSLDSIVGKSERIVEHKKMLQQLLHVPLSTLMIRGETGTGKGHAAKILHRNGLRQENPFIEMNCAALSKDLVESQLFGHETGAFTGAQGRHRGLLEQADNGTLFLDEIGEMPLDVQAKLLKAIEEQTFRRVGGESEIDVDVQIFVASNRDLQAMVVAGDFREDLYHRLNVFEISVPALREYKSDLVDLVPMIVAEYNAHAGKHVNIISDSAWQKMMEYDWPGNIRELRNALERSVLLAKGNELDTSWLNLNNALLEQQLENTSSEDEALSAVHPDTESQGNSIQFVLDGTISLEEMDRQIMVKALELSDQNATKAAQLLGTTRETLRYRIQKYEIDSKDVGG